MATNIQSRQTDASLSVTEDTAFGAILAEEDAIAERRWRTLDDAELNQEIELHRQYLWAVAAQLDALNSRHSNPPRTSASEPATEVGSPTATSGGEAAEGRRAIGDV